MDQIPWWLSFILFFVASFGLICISMMFSPCRAWWLNKWEMKKQEIAEGKAMSSKEKRKIFFHRLRRYLFWPVDFYYSMKETKELYKRVGWPVIILIIWASIIAFYFGIEL